LAAIKVSSSGQRLVRGLGRGQGPGACLRGGVGGGGPSQGHGLCASAAVQTHRWRAARGHGLASVVVLWHGTDSWARRRPWAAASSWGQGGAESGRFGGSSAHGGRQASACCDSAWCGVGGGKKIQNLSSFMCVWRENREGNKWPV
jgi:hypothetical protein